MYPCYPIIEHFWKPLAPPIDTPTWQITVKRQTIYRWIQMEWFSVATLKCRRVMIRKPHISSWKLEQYQYTCVYIYIHNILSIHTYVYIYIHMDTYNICIYIYTYHIQNARAHTHTHTLCLSLSLYIHTHIYIYMSGTNLWPSCTVIHCVFTTVLALGEETL